MTRRPIPTPDRDPDPEPQWFFRRTFTWGLTILACAAIGVMIALMPRGDLQLVALCLVGLIAHLATLYLIAPSAPELARILEALNTRIRIGRSPPPSRPPGDAP